jgi:hypothetical protein
LGKAIMADNKFPWEDFQSEDAQPPWLDYQKNTPPSLQQRPLDPQVAAQRGVMGDIANRVGNFFYNPQAPHPNATSPLQNFEDPVGIDAYVRRHTQAMRDYIDSLTGTKEQQPLPGTVAREMVKGIPVAGRFVPQSDEMTRMEQEFPKTTAAANISDGVLSTAPLGAYTAGARAGPAGVKFLQNVGRQGVFNTGLGELDTMAGHFTSGDWKDYNATQALREAMRNSAIGFGTAGIGAALGKLVSPAAPPAVPARPKFTAKEQDYIDEAKDLSARIREMWSNPPPPGIKPTPAPTAAPVPPWLENTANPAVFAPIGAYLGGEPGAVLGGFIGNGMETMLGNVSKTPWGRTWLTNQIMNYPRNQAILNALMFTGARNAMPGVVVDQDEE